MLTPFSYQVRAIDDLRAARATGLRRLILCMLMAAGKTLCSLELMRLCAEKGMRSLFLCDRRMLADQAVERAREQGLWAGLLLSGRGWDLEAPNQFGSKQTVESWLKRGKLELPPFDLGIIDECHRGVEYQRQLFERHPNVTWVGLTATPCLGNGSGMGGYYQAIVQPVKPSELLALGRIVPVRAFAPHVPDLKGVRGGADGDWSAKSLSARMNRKNLVGDVCGWWQRHGGNRPSVYFACDVAHAISIRDEFRSQGVAAELVCDETPDQEREAIRRQLEVGIIKVVVNCDVLAEGVDWPFVSCVGLVRPTKRLRRYLQNAGRGLRAHPGKHDCIIIDHAGCVLLHGFPDVDREWPLSADDNIDRARNHDPGEPAAVRCQNCTAVFTGSRKCPECGHMNAWSKTKEAKDYALSNGTLIEVCQGDLPPETTKLLMQRFWGSCIGTAIKRHKNAGMAAGMFSGKFKVPPWEAGVEPLPEAKEDWQRPAEEVFPGFARSKR